MRKRGALVPATDFIIAMLLLALFFYFVLHFVEMKRDTQAQQIRLTALRAEASSSLLTLLSLPSGDSTLGLEMTSSVLAGEQVFTSERVQIVKEFMDPFLDTEKQSWRLALYGPYERGYITPEKWGTSVQPITEKIIGTHGAALCEMDREEMAYVVLPVQRDDNKIYRIRLDRCFG